MTLRVASPYLYRRVSSPLIDPTLIYWIPFDEGTGTTGFDRTTNGFNATLVDTAGWSGSSCNGASALTINATDDKATIPAAADLDGLPAMSVMAFFRVATAFPIVDGNIISKNGATSTFGHFFKLYTDEVGGIVTAGFILKIGFNSFTGSGATTLLPDTCYHMAGTYDFNGDQTMKIYLNGVLDGTNSPTPGLIVGNGILETSVGNGSPGVTARPLLNGQVSDVRLYNRELSASEIFAIANP